MDTQYNLNNIGTMVVISLELEVEVFRRQERKSPFLVLLAGYTAKHRKSPFLVLLAGYTAKHRELCVEWALN
mgnify:CR=1 FL=1